MNPNLRIFFKRSIYVIIFISLIAAAFYGVMNYSAIDLSQVGEYIMTGLMGLMMTVMFILIVGVVLRTVWTGIMNRVDTIVKFYPDKKHNGNHIIASHYNPGGESTSGFSSYFHYYLDENGKLYLSKTVENEGSDIEKSIIHLSEQTRLSLEPDLERGIRIGSYSDGENKTNDVIIQTKNKGQLHFRGYEGLIDYGFKISFSKGGQTKWRLRI